MLLVPQRAQPSPVANGHAGNSGDCPVTREEGGDDVKSSWPMSGLHTCYNGWCQRVATRERKLIPKAGPSWDRSLQLDCVNAESLVIANQQVAVNTFLVLYNTAQVTPRSRLYLKSLG